MKSGDDRRTGQATSIVKEDWKIIKCISSLFDVFKADCEEVSSKRLDRMGTDS